MYSIAKMVDRLATIRATHPVYSINQKISEVKIRGTQRLGPKVTTTSPTLVSTNPG